MARQEPIPVTIALSRGGAQPLAVQLATHIRAAIQAGSMRASSRLPSSRALAADLGVARGVVEQAFDQLTAEGWLASAHGSGTFVAAGVAPATPHAPPTAPPSKREDDGSAPIRLDSGTPWVDHRSRDGWRRAWRTVALAQMPHDYPDPAGLPQLRAAVAAHVTAHRGVECGPDDVVITSGSTHGLALLLDVLGPGSVAIEDPGYRAAVAVSRHLGRQVCDIPVDDEGLDVAALRGVAGQVSAVYVTPAHQHPLGIAMSASRRLALIAEAARSGAMVVEDDYDSEFRYDVAPLPALAQLGLDHVTYVGTAAKTLAPGLRIGWLVARRDLVEAIVERRAARHDHPSWPVQRALLTMFDEGYLIRQVRAARLVYAERSQRVRDRLGPYGTFNRDAAGMYLTLAVDAEVARVAIEAAARGGVEVPSLAGYCRTARRDGLVIGFGGPTHGEFERVLDVLESALREAVT